MNIIFVSELADKTLIDYMKSRGKVVIVPKDERFDPRISSHPDLIISILDDTIIVDAHAHVKIFEQLDDLEIPYVTGTSQLAAAYPDDIAYNAVSTKKFLIHNLNYTDSLLQLYSSHMDKTLLHVKQGYTKCSTVVVNDDAIITSDRGIYQTAEQSMNVLLVDQGHVLLEGHDFGFLGGTSASFDDTVVFHGDLSKHPDFVRIATFIEALQKKLIYFEEFPLTDIGSILVLNHLKCKPVESTAYRKHVNIPIFISHEGCPNDCVFCNQRKITAKVEAMTLQEVSDQIQTYYSTLGDETYIELAFFGGSFTGIDPSLQEKYLHLASEYKKAGKIHAIRLSTRPDYISAEILDLLRFYGVDTIELGVQSLNDNVLKASNRGHLVTDVFQAVRLIKSYGFTLGIQLMVGLPEDTRERSILSAKLTALLKPDFVRIYPTLVIQETELLELCRQGKYHPLLIDEAVEWTKEMYLVFLKSQIPVIRIGLQPTDLIAEGKEVVYGPFHPAFRQLVESAYFFDLIRNKLYANVSGTDEQLDITILCNPRDLSQVIGHKRRNIIALEQEFAHIQIKSDQRINPMTVECLRSGIHI